MQPIQFPTIKNHEEFFIIFQGLCTTAELAFNDFDVHSSEIINQSPQTLCKHISYLMSIALVIMGMRGNYMAFRPGDLSLPFFVEIDGVQYDQKYLYAMNDHFANRVNDVLAVLEKNDPEAYETYSTVWRNF